MKYKITTMKKVFIIFCLFAGLFTSCGNTTTKEADSKANTVIAEEKAQSENIVKVYYFHGTRRCKTCIAVGEVSKATIGQYFADNGQVEYLDLNIEEPENQEIAEKYQVAGSGLFVSSFSEEKENYQDITEFAFMYVVQNPDTLKTTIKELVEAGL